MIRQKVREIFCRLTKGHDFQQASITKTMGSGILQMTTTFEFSECTRCQKVVIDNVL